MLETSPEKIWFIDLCILVNIIFCKFLDYYLILRILWIINIMSITRGV